MTGGSLTIKHYYSESLMVNLFGTGKTRRLVAPGSQQGVDDVVHII